MKEKKEVMLSQEGQDLLDDPIAAAILGVVAASVGVRPAEYLLRCEEVLAKEPRAILSVFEEE